MRGSWAGWPKEPIKERECSNCGGTGFMAVVQPKELGTADIPAPVLEVRGKGQNCRQAVVYLVVDFAVLKARGRGMKDFTAKIEKILADAEDCELIGRLATDPNKSDLFKKLAADLRTIARDAQALIAERRDTREPLGCPSEVHESD